MRHFHRVVLLATILVLGACAPKKFSVENRLPCNVIGRSAHWTAIGCDPKSVPISELKANSAGEIIINGITCYLSLANEEHVVFICDYPVTPPSTEL